MEDTRERLNRWTQETPGVIESVTRLVEDRDRLAAAAESAERECGHLRADLEVARAEVGALRKAQAEASEALASGIGRASEALRRLRATTPSDVPRAEPVPPSAPAPAEQPAPEALAVPAAPAPAEVRASIEAAVPPPTPEPAVVERPQLQSAPAGSAAAGHAEGRRILLVDDDPFFRAMITEYLAEHRGYAVVTAETGEDALEKLQDMRPDIVLLDVMMPGMGGIEALQRIKTTYPGLKVLMVSANEDLTIARKALVLGAADYISKPLDLDFLDAALKIYLPAGQTAAETAPEPVTAPALSGGAGRSEQLFRRFTRR